MILLTPRDVADQLVVHTTTVKRMVERGDLDGFQVGSQLRITQASLTAFLEANRITPRAPRATLRRQPPPQGEAYEWLTDAS